MKKKIILVVMLMLISSCAKMELDTAQLKNQVQLNPSEQKVKKSFKESKKNHYYLFQLISGKHPKIADMLSSHATENESIVGLKVSKKITFVDGLICALIGIVYCPDTLTIEGDVVSQEQNN